MSAGVRGDYAWRFRSNDHSVAAMTDTLDPIILNFVYVIFGGALTLFFMWLGCKVFSHIVNFNIPEQLAKGNMAVGMMIMGIFIGIGTALGLVIGLGLN
ncbi:MAG: DUF350 domain-containing protein [Chromatiales bacterium]